MREQENQRNLNKKTGLTSINDVEMESVDGMYAFIVGGPLVHVDSEGLLNELYLDHNLLYLEVPLLHSPIYNTTAQLIYVSVPHSWGTD